MQMLARDVLAKRPCAHRVHVLSPGSRANEPELQSRLNTLIRRLKTVKQTRSKNRACQRTCQRCTEQQIMSAGTKHSVKHLRKIQVQNLWLLCQKHMNSIASLQRDMTDIRQIGNRLTSSFVGKAAW